MELKEFSSRSLWALGNFLPIPFKHAFFHISTTAQKCCRPQRWTNNPILFVPSFPQRIIVILIFFFDCCFSPSTADGPTLSSAPRPLHTLLKNRISRIFPSHLHCPLLVFNPRKKKEDNETDCDKSRQIRYANRSTYC